MGDGMAYVCCCCLAIIIIALAASFVTPEYNYYIVPVGYDTLLGFL